jgi:hypothetical protein
MPAPAPVTPAVVEERTVRARRNTVAEIQLKRVGSRLSLTLKSQLLHDFGQSLLASAVAAGNVTRTQQSRTAVLEGGPWAGLPIYAHISGNLLRDACGPVTATADDGSVTAMSPTADHNVAYVRADGLVQIGIVPFLSPRVATGETIEIVGLYTTKQMQQMVKAWRLFIENIHRQHAQSIVVGARVTVEEYFLPAEMEKMPAAVEGSEETSRA